MPRMIIAVVVGTLLGTTGPYYSFLRWFSLIPWGIAGLVLGYRSRPGESARTGMLYGFSLCFTFLVAGYNGNASLISRLPFFGMISVFGAICGLTLALVGFFIYQKHWL